MTAKRKTVKRTLELIPLSKLKPALRNPKDHDHGAIDSSISRFGYVEPIVMDERTGRLVAGHGRVTVVTGMRDGKQDAPEGVEVVKGEWCLPVLRGWRSKSDGEADAYLLASNRTTELGGWHDSELLELLKDLAASNNMDGTGYSHDDIDGLAKLLDDLPPAPSEDDGSDGGGGEESSTDQATCPQCGHTFTA